MNGKGRPKAALESPAKKTTDTVPPTSPVVVEAETILLLDALARAAIADLTTKQLRGLVWLGILDSAWRHIFAELDRRGEVL